jgi:hypothetical protein
MVNIMANATQVPAKEQVRIPARVLSKESDDVKRVPLSDVLVRSDWNARGGKWAEQGDGGELPDGTEGIKSLALSIRIDGQRQPVDLRPNTTKSRHPYELVTGFRRVEALRRIQEEDKTSDATVRAVIHAKMNETEARALNIEENTARDSLELPDLVFAIGQYDTLLSSADAKAPTGVQIAATIGKSQGYVAQLQKIARGVKPAILERWRSELRDSDKLTVQTMRALAEVDRGKQEEELKKILGDASKVGRGDWLGAACKRAAGVGALLGTLVKEFKINALDTKCQSSDMFEQMVAEKIGIKYSKPGKDAVTKKQMARIVKAMAEGYMAAKLAEDEEEEEESDEGDE